MRRPEQETWMTTDLKTFFRDSLPAAILGGIGFLGIALVDRTYGSGPVPDEASRITLFFSYSVAIAAFWGISAGMAALTAADGTPDEEQAGALSYDRRRPERKAA
jgi:hypothetical protein